MSHLRTWGKSILGWISCPIPKFFGLFSKDSPLFWPPVSSWQQGQGHLLSLGYLSFGYLARLEERALLFLFLLALDKISRIILNKWETLQDFKKTVFLKQFFSMGLIYIAFIMFLPFIISFFRAFIMKECWTLPRAFSASCVWFLSLYLLMGQIAFIDLHILNNLCIP